jgi:small-conductance mechanosensitive channel
MNIARHVILVVCLTMAGAAACLTGQQHFSEPEDPLLGVIFGAIAILAVVGVLGFVAQFFAKRTSRVLLSIFFGFLAGIMATNFICDIVGGETYSSLSGYIVNYGLMLLFFCLSVGGLALLQISGLQNNSLQASATMPRVLMEP